jgi:hypothetical protein
MLSLIPYHIPFDLAEQRETQDKPWLRFTSMWQDVREEEWERFQTAVTATGQTANQTIAAVMRRL